MLDQMANHSTIIRRIMNDVGQDVVEDFIDSCLTLDNLIDIHSPFKNQKRAQVRRKKLVIYQLQNLRNYNRKNTWIVM